MATENTIEDLMLLFGVRKGRKVYTKWVSIEVEAENAWYEGLNADANPYLSGTIEHGAWYRTWRNCNENC